MIFANAVEVSNPSTIDEVLKFLNILVGMKGYENVSETVYENGMTVQRAAFMTKYKNTHMWVFKAFQKLVKIANSESEETKKFPHNECKFKLPQFEVSIIFNTPKFKGEKLGPVNVMIVKANNWKETKKRLEAVSVKEIDFSEVYSPKD